MECVCMRIKINSFLLLCSFLVYRRKLRLKQKHIKILRDMRNNHHDYCINFIHMHVDRCSLQFRIENDTRGKRMREKKINGIHV